MCARRRPPAAATVRDGHQPGANVQRGGTRREAGAKPFEGPRRHAILFWRNYRPARVGEEPARSPRRVDRSANRSAARGARRGRRRVRQPRSPVAGRATEAPSARRRHPDGRLARRRSAAAHHSRPSVYGRPLPSPRFLNATIAVIATVHALRLRPVAYSHTTAPVRGRPEPPHLLAASPRVRPQPATLARASDSTLAPPTSPTSTPIPPIHTRNHVDHHRRAHAHAYRRRRGQG